MTEAVQLAIVTAAAVAALGLIVRPYFRRASLESGQSCASCPSGKKPKPLASGAVHPLRLIRR